MYLLIYGKLHNSIDTIVVWYLLCKLNISLEVRTAMLFKLKLNGGIPVECGSLEKWADILRMKSFTFLKSDNLQYNTMERWIDGKIVLPSDGPRFILIDWE